AVDRPRRGDRVELVRVVQDGRLGGLGRPGVVVGGDRMKQLRTRGRVERLGPLFDQPRAQVDVAEQAPLGGLPEARGRLELDGAAQVVEQGRGEDEIGAEPWMKLAELAADRRDADRVLEQPAGVDVVTVRRRRQRAEPPPDFGVTEDLLHDRTEPLVRDLVRDELEEAVELLRSAAPRRCEPGRILLGCGLDRPNVELEPVAVALDAAEHAYRVALAEAGVEQLDVVPDASLDASARVDELEREVRRAALRA